jgi:heat shock protein HslJ
MNPTPSHILLAIATAGLFTLAACGDPSTEPADSVPTTAAGSPSTDPGSTQVTTPSTDLAALLDGRAFLSQSATGITLAPGAVLRLEFLDGQVSFSGGCNGHSGPATFDGDQLTVGPMMSTMMACDQPLMDQDSAVAAMLNAGVTVQLDGDNLALTGADGARIELLDRVVADPDRPLEGTTWVVNGVISDEAVSSGWGEAEATITIVDGQAQVNAGCNRGMATVTISEGTISEGTISEGTITFGPLALTKMACEDEAMQLENAVTTVLQGDVTFDIEAANLTLMNGTNGLMLTADEG